MTTSNKMMSLISAAASSSTASSAISGFTDVQGGVASVTSNKTHQWRLRSFSPNSKVKPKSIDAVSPVPAPVFTVATLPNATDLFGHYAYVIDAIGGPTLVFSDGESWRRWADRTTI
jgi:hypothetical protein